MGEHPTISDQELLRLISENDQKAFNKLFERYRDHLFHYLLKITKSNETSEEIVLDVFLKIWTGRSILTEIDNFEAFLFRVGRNKAFDFLRWTQKSKFQQMELWNRMHEMHASETADYDISLQETTLIIQMAIEQLSPQRKRVFQMSREEGLTYEQISKRLQISTHTVRNHVAASLQFIRSHLKAEYGWILILISYCFLHK